MRVLFMGTCEFGRAVAQILHAVQPLCGVLTRPPAPQDRGHGVQPSPVHEWAQKEGLEVMCPPTLKGFDMGALAPDIVVVASYGLLIPSDLLALVPFVNVHPSLLPRWRGANPVGAAILAGDILTGCTIMLMDEGLDTGPLLHQEPVTIAPEDTQQTLFEKMLQVVQRVLWETVCAYQDGLLLPVAQNDAAATFSQKFTKAMGALDFLRPVDDVLRQVRAFFPQPGAWTTLGGRRLRVLSASRGTAAPLHTAAGAFVHPCGWVCGDGFLLLPQIVVPEGRKPMAWKELMHGWRNPSFCA